MEERVQKILAQAGFGSRRACEEFIIAGRVRVNGQVAILGMKADAVKDTIQLDGQAIPRAETKRYIALHKPRGVLSDIDQADPRPTVRDLVPVPGHLFTVGRLDFDSEGLILLTNDGELANRLTHPRYGHEKEYRVLVATRPDEEQLNTWRRGVVLEDGHKTAPAQVRVEHQATKGVWLQVILHEGRKRQIREVGTRIGLPVQRIVRVRIGSLELGNLKEREWRDLTDSEVRLLKGLAGRPERPRKYSNRSQPGQARRGSERPAVGGESEFRPTGDRPTRWRPTGESNATGQRGGPRKTVYKSVRGDGQNLDPAKTAQPGIVRRENRPRPSDEMDHRYPVPNLSGAMKRVHARVKITRLAGDPQENQLRAANEKRPGGQNQQ